MVQEPMLPLPRSFVIVALVLLGASPASPQELGLERVWAVGEAFGSEAETWHRLEDATVVNGHVVAVDMFLPTVRVFTVGASIWATWAVTVRVRASTSLPCRSWPTTTDSRCGTSPSGGRCVGVWTEASSCTSTRRWRPGWED